MNLPDDAANDLSQAPARTSRLARLRHALAAHNWVGVGIEIMIVMVGVLLAFEFEQWGQRRARAADERQFLERLYVEYGRAGDELRDLKTDHEKIIHDVGLVMANADRPDRLREFARTKEFGCALGRFRDAPYNDTSFEELVASGRINIISDLKLRGEVRDLAAAQAASARQIETSRMLMMSQIATLDNYYHFTMNPDGRATCVVDWPDLMQDRKAVNAALRAYRTNGYSLDARGAVLAQIEALRGELACKLGKRECRRAATRPA